MYTVKMMVDGKEVAAVSAARPERVVLAYLLHALPVWPVDRLREVRQLREGAEMAGGLQ